MTNLHRNLSDSLSMLEATPAAPLEFADMLSMFRACVAERANEPALFYFDGTVRYGELDAHSDALAVWLLHQGVSPGDRIMVILQNMPQFVMMAVAAWKIGAIPVPANPMYKVRELSLLFADAEPKAALCLDTQADDVRAAAKQAGLALVVMDTSPHSFQTRSDGRVLPPRLATSSPLLESIVAATAAAKPPHRDIDGETLGLILYTSGTTGVPKGAMIRHSSLTFNAQFLRDFSALNAQSRILAMAPLFHITGFACHLATTFSARAAQILHYRVEPTLMLDIIKEHRPTYTVGAITAYNALSNLPDISHDAMASFDRLYSGGAPIAPALVKHIEARLGTKIHSCYGMTETTAPAVFSPFMADIPVDEASGALSIGKLIPGTAGKIVDENNAILPIGQTGELMVKGPQIMSGYWRKPAESAAALEGGWMHTGDVAFMDEQGWIYLVDRLKDVIIASGFKVWPREVEDVLYAHGAVREAAVIGVPDSYRGETVTAFVSLKPGAKVEPQLLIDHCRVQLAAYKAPRSITILDELPKTVTGKIQRMALRTT